MTYGLILSVVGSLRGFKEVNFRFGEKRGRYTFASVFYRCEVERDLVNLFLMPKTLGEGEEETLIAGLPEGLPCKVLPLPAVGRDQKGCRHTASYDYMRFYIFVNLVKEFLESGEIKKIIADINQGLNVYVDILKEAVRSFKVFHDLMFLGTERGLDTEILFSEPLIGVSEVDTIEAEIFLSPLRVKTFFESPLKPTDIKTDRLVVADLDRSGIRILKRFYRTYRAVRGNAPLVVLTFGYDPPTRIREFMKNLVDLYLERYCRPEGWKVQGGEFVYTEPEDPSFNILVLMSLALYHAIATGLEKLGLPDNGGEWFSLEDIGRFEDLYRAFGLLPNADLLRRDVGIEGLIRNRVGKVLRTPGEVPEPVKDKLLSYGGCFLSELERKVRDSRRIDRRNFWAHSGLEGNVTKVRVVGNRIEVSYSQDSRDRLSDLMFNL